MSMLRFTSICLVCVVVLAAGEEHSHINDSTQEALVGDLAAYHEDGHQHHDGHVHHDHSDHGHDHDDHTNHKILQISTAEAEHIVDYKTWLAASGKIRCLSRSSLLLQ